MPEVAFCRSLSSLANVDSMPEVLDSFSLFMSIIPDVNFVMSLCNFFLSASLN